MFWFFLVFENSLFCIFGFEFLVLFKRVIFWWDRVVGVVWWVVMVEIWELGFRVIWVWVGDGGGGGRVRVVFLWWCIGVWGFVWIRGYWLHRVMERKFMALGFIWWVVVVHPLCLISANMEGLYGMKLLSVWLIHFMPSGIKNEKMNCFQACLGGFACCFLDFIELGKGNSFFLFVSSLFFWLQEGVVYWWRRFMLLLALLSFGVSSIFTPFACGFVERML